MRSTRIKIENEISDATSLTNEKRMRDMYIKIYNANDTLYCDQTGCFPATPTNRNQYIMVLVEVDGDYIDVEPMKNQSAGPMVKTYQILWKRLTEKGSIRQTM